jgi:glycerophosphoryl diester phosphodiesterase
MVVSSFNALALLTLRRVAPELPRAMLAQSRSPLPLRRLWLAAAVAPAELHVEAALATPRLCAAAHRSGRAVVAWTVNDVATAVRLASLGVDGIITDVPDLIRAGASERLRVT